MLILFFVAENISQTVVRNAAKLLVLGRIKTRVFSDYMDRLSGNGLYQPLTYLLQLNYLPRNKLLLLYLLNVLVVFDLQ